MVDIKSSLWIKRSAKCNCKIVDRNISLVVSIRLKQVMKEDNEHYSATKESLKTTIKELRETVSHIYYIPVFVYLKLIVSNEEKMQK